MLDYPTEQEIEALRSLISRYFPVYNVSINYDSMVFHCEVDEARLEEDFDRLRIEMRDKGYVPVIKNIKGEYVIFVKRFPRMKYRGTALNIAMFLLTIITTSIAGVLQWYSYVNPSQSSADIRTLFTLSNILYGEIFFTIPLLTILGVHEMGHYLMAKRRNIRASLPFFIPFMPPLGTMGAFISIREPIPDRKSLLDIGIAGPIAGFIVAIPVTVLGLYLGAQNPQPAPAIPDSGTVIIGLPLIYQLMALFIPVDGIMHPLAFAGWVGFLVTAINLLPAGQLDGGHIARALFGDKAKYVSYGAVIFLLVLGLEYTGWLIFAFLIILLGVNHTPPLNDISKLKPDRKALGAFGIVLLLICFVPIPFQPIPAVHDIEAYPFAGEGNNTTAMPGSTVYFNFTVKNNGTVGEDITMLIPTYPRKWSAFFFIYNTSNSSSSFQFHLSPGEEKNFTLEVDIPQNESAGDYKIGVLLSSKSGTSIKMDFLVSIPSENTEVPG